MRGVIFDLDGTLVDTLADITRSLSYALESLGQPQHPPERTVNWVGWGVRHLVEQAIDDPEKLDEAVALFREHYAANLVVDTVPYPGIDELLGQLATDGTPMAVLSNKPHAMTVRVVESLFDRVPFAEVRGHRPPTPKKPDPTAALELAEAMALPAADVVFVGDTAVDMETARRADMTPVAVSWGFRPADHLRDAGAALVIETPAELGAWLSRQE